MDTTAINFRIAEEGDIDSLALALSTSDDILKKFFLTKDFSNIDMKVIYKLALFRKSRISYFSTYTIAQSGSKVLGYAQLVDSGKAKAELCKESFMYSSLGNEFNKWLCSIIADKEMLISSFYVLPEYRRIGIGKNLMKNLLARIRRNAARSVSIAIDRHNTDGVAFFEKQGFIEDLTSSKDYDLFCESICPVILKLKLSPCLIDDCG